MSISKQSLLGAFFLLAGGSILFYAMSQQADMPNTKIVDNGELSSFEEFQSVNIDTITPNETETIENNTLTTDIATEAKILDEKQKERQAQVQKQEAQALEFIQRKEEAAANALVKAREENEAFIANRTPVNNKSNNTNTGSSTNNSDNSDNSAYVPINNKTNNYPSKNPVNKQEGVDNHESVNSLIVEPRPETYQVRKGEGLIKVAEMYDIPVNALAEVNDMSILDTLMYGQQLIIPKKEDEAGLIKKAQERERKLRIEQQKKAKVEAERKAKAEADRKAKLVAQQKKIDAEILRKQQEALKSPSAKRDANQKLIQARAQVKQEDAKGTFGVQVALAANQVKADEIAKQFRSAGYQVKTSKTSRGVRVLIGPERGKIAALALKDKINSDPKVKVSNAWVLFWR